MRPKNFLVLACLSGLALAVFFAAQPTVDRTGLPSLAASELDLRHLDEKLAPAISAIEASRLTGISQPVMIEITEAELFSKVASWSHPGIFLLGISDVETYLSDDGMTFIGRLNFLALDFEFRTDTRIRIENGRRDLSIVAAQIGSVHAPEWMRNLTVGAIESTVNAGLPRIPMNVRTLIVSDHVLVISGVTLGV